MGDVGRRSTTFRAALAYGILGVVLLVLCPAPSLAQPTPARPCDPMQVPGFTSPVTPPPGPSSTDVQLVPLSLPVVVHYMSVAGSGNDFSSTLAPAKLVKYFADGGKVNKIWRHAAIRLYIQRFESCTFSFARFEGSRSSTGEIISPARSTDGRDLFYKINEIYNAPDVRGIDLYVWLGIDRDGGYGDRWRGPVPAVAAWIDTDCAQNEHPDCDLMIAHEIGHFLGLCHACVITDPVPVTCTRCLPSSMRRPDGTYILANCNDVPDKRIMRNDNLKRFLPYTVSAQGVELNQCERRLANAFARRRLMITTRHERSDDMGGGGMGKLGDKEKHVVMFECNGSMSAEQAAKFTADLHDLLRKNKSNIIFDITGPRDN